MQDVTAEICASTAEGTKATLTDRRDNNTYAVAKINGNCWMTQNLRLSGGRKLTSADSNVTRDYTLPSTQLAGNSESYTAPQTTISSNTSYGGYYNFCAASAGTVCSQTYVDASQSICPAGWTLPTRTQFDAIAGDSSYSSAFSPVYSGFYNLGSLGNTGAAGSWWSANAYSSGYQYNLFYNSGSLYTSNYNDKRLGFSVRCVRSS